MVTDNFCCQLRALSQKIKTYKFCNSMNTVTPNTLEGLHPGKNNVPVNFIGAKSSSRKKR